MLSKPDCGWTTVSLDGFEATASYITDVPFEWLRACLHALENESPLALYLDQEGSESYILSYFETTYAIHDGGGDSTTCTVIRGLGYLEVAEEILRDIRAHFGDWVAWYDFEDPESEDLEPRRAELSALADAVEAALAEARSDPPDD